MSPQLFWRSHDEVHGPFSTDELERVFRDNRIADGDHVRLDGTDDWLPAREVKAMFAAPNEASANTASEAAARALAHAPYARLMRRPESASRSVALVGWMRNTRRSLAGLLGNLGEWLAAGVARLSKLGAVFGRKTTLAVLAVIFVAIVLRNVDFGDTQNREVFEQLSTMWDELQSLEQRGASETERQQFKQQTLVWLNGTIASLEATARHSPIGRRSWFGSGQADAEARRQLIYTTRTFQRLLESAEQGQEQQFVNGMTRVHDFLTAKPSAAQPTIAGQATHAGTPAEPLDPLVAGVMILDALLIAGGLFYWWRRRRALA